MAHDRRDPSGEDIKNDIPDSGAAVEFLQRWRPGGPWVLTAIHPSRKSLPTRTFRETNLGDLQRWLDEYNGNHNIYFHVNSTLHDLTKKADREDIASVDWLHIDIDPRAGEDIAEEQKHALGLLRENLPEGIPAPTVIVFSGGGYQAFWRLQDPIPVDGNLAKAEDAKRYSQQLEILFGADNCHNIDRIMRLPGTINIPNAQKRKKGRVPTLATLVSFNNNIYPLDTFTPAPVTQMEVGLGREGVTVQIPDKVERVADLAELDEWSVPDRVKVIIAQGGHPDEPPKEGKDTSRSGWLWDASCQLRRCGVPDEIMLGIITDPQWAISAHILDQPNPLKAAQRLILRTKDTVDAEVTEFEMNKDGVPYPNQHNIRVALRKLGVRLSHDQFADRLLVDGFSGHGPVLQDEDIAAIYLLIDERFKFRPGKDFFWMVLEDEARRNGFHPVREYLDGLAWDGQPRIDKWLTRYGGAEDNLYVQAVGALVLMAAVRRIRKPGCKFDEMLVLRSPQGSLKSTALQTLVPNSDWFTDDLPLGADTKVVIERLHGRWIVEAAELQGMRRGDVEHLKAFLSRQFDRARMAYGRITKEVLRQCVIVGTTNSERFLKDMTGNRRFWPVQVEKFDLDALRRDRDQLWAEAAHREAAGASIRLDPALYPAAAEAQDSHLIEDPFVGRLVDVLGNMEGKLKAQDAFEIVGVPYGQRTQDHNSRLGEAMRELGWERTKLRFDGVPQWAYVRGDRSKRIELHRDENGNLEIRPSGFKELF